MARSRIEFAFSINFLALTESLDLSATKALSPMITGLFGSNSRTLLIADGAVDRFSKVSRLAIATPISRQRTSER